jgi:hypothetical protein
MIRSSRPEIKIFQINFFENNLSIKKLIQLIFISSLQLTTSVGC